jgi:hypothetical protein
VQILLSSSISLLFEILYRPHVYHSHVSTYQADPASQIFFHLALIDCHLGPGCEQKCLGPAAQRQHGRGLSTAPSFQARFHCQMQLHHYIQIHGPGGGITHDVEKYRRTLCRSNKIYILLDPAHQ